MRFSGLQPAETSRSLFRFDIASAAFSFRRPNLLLRIVSLSICMGVAFLPAAGQSAGPTAQIKDTEPVVHVLCGKSVALLGETPVHGFGKTLEFKVGLVRRLIDECHYNAFFIESGIYDFLNIQKRLNSGQEVTEPMISAAIGGLWATHEVQPMILFLLDRAKAGRVILGGLDDQLQRGTYAQREMASDFVEYLQGQGDEKARCLAILQRHALWQYTDDSPYGPKDKALILGCLDSIETGLTKAPLSAAPFRENYTKMVESLKRLLAWDFRQDIPKGVDEGILDRNDRDHWMYVNFQWFLSRLPAHSKVIVWAANVHVAKDLSGVPGEEGLVPFGFYVRREFKSRAFALGFSAYSGSYAMTGQPVRQLSVAPDDSLEAQALAGRDSDTIYISVKQLRKFGSVGARPLGTTFKTARWDDVLDGLVVFREERAPEYLHR
jgi:erythromycin esterase-like protein